MKKITLKRLMATVAGASSIALLTTVGPVMASGSHDSFHSDSKITLNVSVTNVPGSITDAEKIAELISVRACPIELTAVEAPATIPANCLSDENVFKLQDDATLENGTLTGTAKLAGVNVPTNLAIYVQNRSKLDLGLAASAGTGFLSQVDSTTTSVSSVATLALPNLTTPATGSVKGGKSVLVNLTVTGVPAQLGKSERLSSVIRVRACKLAVDAIAADLTPSAGCLATKNSLLEITKPSSANGVFSAKVRLASPAASTTQNYGLYVTVRANKGQGLASQIGAGQFVVVTSDANGVGSVTTGIDGLTLSLTGNTGAGVNDRVINVVVPATGSYAVVITSTDSKGRTRAVAMIPVAAGAASVALPSTLEKGNYSAALVNIGSTGAFSIDRGKNLVSPLTLSAVTP